MEVHEIQEMVRAYRERDDDAFCVALAAAGPEYVTADVLRAAIAPFTQAEEHRLQRAAERRADAERVRSRIPRPPLVGVLYVLPRTTPAERTAARSAFQYQANGVGLVHRNFTDGRALYLRAFPPDEAPTPRQRGDHRPTWTECPVEVEV